MKDSVASLYDKHYQSIGFERAGLFELIQKQFLCETALYPGCLIHITPSFYFAHVVYVDHNPLSREFFSQKEQVAAFIHHYKK